LQRIKGLTFDAGCTLFYEDACVGRSPSATFINGLSRASSFLRRNGYNIDVEDLMEGFKHWRELAGVDEQGSPREYWMLYRLYFVLKYNGITPAPDLVMGVYREYCHGFVETVKLYDDVKPFLKWAKERGLRIGIISNISSHEVTIEAVKIHGLLGYIDIVITSQLIGVKKPLPEIFVSTARLLGLEPDSIIHIGDNEVVDFDGALNAGYAGAIYLARHKPCSRSPCCKDLYCVMEYLEKQRL